MAIVKGGDFGAVQVREPMLKVEVVGMSSLEYDYLLGREYWSFEKFMMSQKLSPTHFKSVVSPKRHSDLRDDCLNEFLSVVVLSYYASIRRDPSAFLHIRVRLIHYIFSVVLFCVLSDFFSRGETRTARVFRFFVEYDAAPPSVPFFLPR